jgi:ketol-acid reductoisomerase
MLKASGCSCRVLETTGEETETDLFGEQVACAEALALIAGFETLVMVISARGGLF